MELEILSTAAQIAVALAGFAGVVVVFRRESVHEWSPVDKFRLRLLLSNSVFPLAYSVFAMLLLAMKPPPESIWRWCSGFAAICQIQFAITSIKRTRALSAADFKDVSKIVFYPLFALASAVLLLQFYNLAVLNWFWPFFAGIFVHLLGAIVQFFRLVLLLPANGKR
jgi:hypothetical protein